MANTKSYPPLQPIPFMDNGRKVLEDYYGVGFRYDAIPAGLIVRSLVEGAGADNFLQIDDIITKVKIGNDWLPTTDKNKTLRNLRGEDCTRVTFMRLRDGAEEEITAPRIKFREVELPPKAPNGSKEKLLLHIPDAPECQPQLSGLDINTSLAGLSFESGLPFTPAAGRTRV